LESADLTPLFKSILALKQTVVKKYLKKHTETPLSDNLAYYVNLVTHLNSLLLEGEDEHENSIGPRDDQAVEADEIKLKFSDELDLASLFDLQSIPTDFLHFI